MTRCLGHSSETWKEAESSLQRLTDYPSYFSTAQLRDIGSFQDGGLQDNFAAGIAARISRRIWPSRVGIARLVSMGTGEAASRPDQTPHFRHVFRDSFLRRGFDAFMSNLDTKAKWLQMVDQLDCTVRADYLRMDVSLGGMPCTLDNAEIMDDYRNLVILQPGSARLAKEAAIGLLVARFFFTLDGDFEKPVIGLDLWYHGTIRCKGPAMAVVEALRRLSLENVDFVTDSETLGAFGGVQDICPACGRYSKTVSFTLRHPGEIMNIYMRVNQHKQWRISGFPASMSSFAEKQYLYDQFGRLDHGRPATTPCNTCNAAADSFRGKRRKRTSVTSTEERRNKRVCIAGDVAD